MFQFKEEIKQWKSKSALKRAQTMAQGKPKSDLLDFDTQKDPEKDWFGENQGVTT